MLLLEKAGPRSLIHGLMAGQHACTWRLKVIFVWFEIFVGQIKFFLTPGQIKLKE